MDYYRAHSHEGADPESLADLRERCARVLSDALGVEVDAATLVAAIWGLFIWREFRAAPLGTSKYLGMMLAGYSIGLILIGAATQQ